MSYYDIVKPNFRIEYWLNCCRGLVGQNREKWINLIILPANTNSELTDEHKRYTTIIDLINTRCFNENNLLESMVEQILNELLND